MPKEISLTMSNESGNIGIFWLVHEKGEEKFIFDKCILQQGETYGDAITWGGHYEFWQKIRSKNSKKRLSTVPLWSEYEEWPRGRVVYNKNKQCFIIYSDKKLLSENIKKGIIELFSLEDCKKNFFVIVTI